MTRIVLVAIAGALLWAPAASAADVMVVGRDGVLAGPKRVALEPRSIRVDGRRCAVGARTPLSLLAATRLPLRASDQGICGRSARNAGTIYVEAIAGQAERGSGGWVYKVGRRSGTAGAADPSGPFGSGRLVRPRDRVLWFWCVQATNCQRTLEVRAAARTVGRGGALRVRVRGYDDFARGVAVAGATVRLGGSSAITGADGTATVRAPARAGRARVFAERAGMVRSFPVRVRVR